MSVMSEDDDEDKVEVEEIVGKGVGMYVFGGTLAFVTTGEPVLGDDNGCCCCEFKLYRSKK
jgi:hypothetical protein